MKISIHIRQLSGSMYCVNLLQYWRFGLFWDSALYHWASRSWYCKGTTILWNIRNWLPNDTE